MHVVRRQVGRGGHVRQVATHGTMGNGHAGVAERQAGRQAGSTVQGVMQVSGEQATHRSPQRTQACRPSRAARGHQGGCPRRGRA